MRTFRPHVPASEVRTWQVTAAVFRHSRTAPARVRVARRRSGRAPALPGRPAPDPPPLRPTRVADARRAIAGAKDATRPRRALAPTGRRRGRARLERGQVLISPGRWCVTGSGHAESWGRHSRNRCSVARGDFAPPGGRPELGRPRSVRGRCSGQGFGHRPDACGYGFPPLVGCLDQQTGGLGLCATDRDGLRCGHD